MAYEKESYTPEEVQAEVDRVVGKEREKIRTSYEKQLGELNEKFTKTVEELLEAEKKAQALPEMEQAKQALELEKVKLSSALEFGVPADKLTLLSANDPETIKKQAEEVAELVKKAGSGTFTAKKPGGKKSDWVSAAAR